MPDSPAPVVAAAPSPVETPAVSPNGQLVGLSALLNKLPPWAMNVVMTLTGLAVLVQMMPDGLPPVVVAISSKVVAVGVLLGIASPGARK